MKRWLVQVEPHWLEKWRVHKRLVACKAQPPPLFPSSTSCLHLQPLSPPSPPLTRRSGVPADHRCLYRVSSLSDLWWSAVSFMWYVPSSCCVFAWFAEDFSLQQWVWFSVKLCFSVLTYPVYCQKLMITGWLSKLKLLKHYFNIHS